MAKVTKNTEPEVRELKKRPIPAAHIRFLASEDYLADMWMDRDVENPLNNQGDGK